MASNTTDLNREEKPTISSLTNNDKGKQKGYKPKTLKQHNRTRQIYLPLFPTISFGPNSCLLLANVPVTCLAPHEIAQRQHGAYTSDALTMMKNYNYSDRDGFSLSQQDADELSKRLQVGLSIITFNAVQLRGICYTLLTLHEKFRRNVLLRIGVPLDEPTLNSKQMAVALEFFLQMDVDTFCMKTCSFRGAESSRSAIEGLFCGKDGPQPRHTMVPCDNLFCPCCHPLNSWQRSEPWPVVDFVSSSMHQFVNGYTTYLNCPVTCNTSNLIYTMTCPCGHYDYVDSTVDPLANAMTFHRKHGNRIIHEFLTGSSVFPGITLDPNQREKDIVNKMRLYQHSARCPTALRSFLDCNPDYWCFIPLLRDEAEVENIADAEECRKNSSSSSEVIDLELSSIIAVAAISNHRVARCLDHVPIPPAAYAFSGEQRQQQRSFFQAFLASPIDQAPYSVLDMFKVAVIAVLPDDHSTVLRYIIETLFIIHGETKLNMICPIGGSDPEKRYGPPHNGVWCKDLNRPFICTVMSAH